MAGIYQPWVDIESGETMDTFSIVTTKANGLMEMIHNKKKRMPTILNEEQTNAWLDPNSNESTIMELASHQMDENLMDAYTLKKSFKNELNPKESFFYTELNEQKLF